MMQYAATRRSSPASASFVVPVQPSQLWARRMGSKHGDFHTGTGPHAMLSTSANNADMERPVQQHIPDSETALGLIMAPTPPTLLQVSASTPRPVFMGDDKPITPLSTRSSTSLAFLSDIWTPQEGDNLVSPLPTSTPLYPHRHKSSQDLRSHQHPLPSPAIKSAGNSPKLLSAPMEKDNTAVAVQVALQIIGQDGGYDSEDEQYCRQALRWLQDPSYLHSGDGMTTAGLGRARSKTDAGKLSLQDDSENAMDFGNGGDDSQPKRKGRARMSQEKRRRLARRKEREALMLLGLPPLPSSAPDQTTAFRLPPLITNTLASMASSTGASPADRAKAVVAARALIASAGLLNAGDNSIKSTADTLDRRQGSMPNLRAAQSALNYPSANSYFSQSPIDSLPSPSSAAHELDGVLGLEARMRPLSISTSAGYGSPWVGGPGMPSLSRGGSVGSSPASTPLQTPDNSMLPLPPMPFAGANGSVGLDFKLADGLHSAKQVDQAGTTMAPTALVPNLRVMPPTPHQKATSSYPPVPGFSPLRTGRDADARSNGYDYPNGDAQALSALSASTRGAMNPPGLGATSSSPTSRPSPFANATRPRSHTSLHTAYGNAGNAANKRASYLSATADTLARAEQLWRAPVRRDLQLAPVSPQPLVSNALAKGPLHVAPTMSMAGVADLYSSGSAADRPTTGPSRNASFITTSSTMIPSPSSRTGSLWPPSQAHLARAPQQHTGPEAGFGAGLGRVAADSALGIELNMGGPLDVDPRRHWA